MLSVVILTHKDERGISSFDWADEVVIVSDEEKPLACDFAAKRNWGLAKAQGDWVLFIDPDEEVSEELRDEIPMAIGMTKYDGFYINRRDYFMGRWLRFGETGQVRLLRLAKKDAGVWKRKVHEYWDIKNAGELKNPLKHFAHPTIGSFISKINLYSDIDAGEFQHLNYFDLLKPVGKFLNNYFFKLGFLDGVPGLAMAIMMSIYSLTVRVKQFEYGLS